MHRSILSLSLLCTLDTPCVHDVSCNLIFCCVIQNDRTPLYLASFRGHTEIVAMLLKFGADFNSCSKVSTSYFITPISTVSEYVYVYTYINVNPCSKLSIPMQLASVAAGTDREYSYTTGRGQ